jgi:ribonucleoside-diphosphate reductase alpha chain
LATALSALGHDYGSTSFMATMTQILATLRDEAYTASARNAAVKGSFPLFDPDKYLATLWSRTLPSEVRDLIARVGLRNSHLLSIAPTGTISMAADNVSSGIEPVFATSVTRTVQTFDGPTQMELQDYGYARGWRTGRLANQCTAQDHVKVLTTAQGYVDSAISKTCNVGEDVTWADFKNLYMEAWQDGAKGCTTFRAAGKRMGILTAKKEAHEDQPEACVVDPETGNRECA